MESSTLRSFLSGALLLLVVGAGCDKPADEAASTSAQTQNGEQADERGEPTSGKFTVDLRISPTSDVYQVEGAPKPDAVKAKLLDALYATPAFERDGTRKLDGTLTYDVRALPDGGGQEVLLLGALNSPNANFTGGANLQATDEKWAGKSVAEMVDGAIAQFAEQVGAQARVIGGGDDELLAILQNTDEPDSARLMAIQEIRERKLTAHADAVRAFLAPERPAKLRLAASAALVSLGDQESRGEIIKVAEDFSRDRDPQYVPMLHILGDLGGTEVVTYLEAVAEGHSAPAVRTVAQEALTKARQVEAP